MSATEKSKPAPLETEPGKQLDDNIDDLGRKQDGTLAKPSHRSRVTQHRGLGLFEAIRNDPEPDPSIKGVHDDDPSSSPMTERGPDGRAHKTAETEAGESGPEPEDDILPRPSIVPTNPDCEAGSVFKLAH